MQESIVTTHIPQLPNTRSGNIKLHRRAVAPFTRFLADVESAGLLTACSPFNGSWVPRFVRGSQTNLSHHAYGAAIDLNAQYNRLATVPALKGKQGSVRELVPIANKHGIYWGGHFKRRPDGMHFELAKLEAGG